VLEAEKQDFRVSAARTKRLPLFQIGVLGGQLLHAVDSTLGPGAHHTALWLGAPLRKAHPSAAVNSSAERAA